MKLNRLPLTTLLSAALGFVSLVPITASAQNTIIPCSERPFGTADSVCHGAIGVGGTYYDPPPIIPTGPVCAAQQKRAGTIEYLPYTPYTEVVLENTQSFGDATRPMLARFGFYDSPINNNNEVQVVFCRAGYSAADLNAVGGLSHNYSPGQLATVYTQGGSTLFLDPLFRAISQGAGSNAVKIYYRYASNIYVGGD